MNKKQTIMLAVAGVALAVTSQAQAQFGYAADDLLLNFRLTSTTGFPAGNDLEVNMGSISSIASLAAGTTETILQGGSTGTLESEFGAANISKVGFSAAAADTAGSTGSIWLTRVATAAATQGTTPVQNPYSTQATVNNKINNIGTGADNGVAYGTDLLGDQVYTVTAASGSGNSYQNQAQAGTGGANQAKINYGGTITLLQGNIEAISGGSTKYLNLWSEPTSDGANPGYGTSSGPNVWLGYFTFDADGEVDYTSEAVQTAVPEASTYGLMAGLGLLGLALRRQFRTLAA